MILGIDFGYYSTDAVFVKNKKIVKAFSFPRMEIKNIEKELIIDAKTKICITGGKAEKFKGALFGFHPKKIPELKAIVKGALKLSGKKKALVASMGTGTAVVYSKNFKHLAGASISGGTLQGLGKLLLKTNDFVKIEKMASLGSLKKINLSVKDIKGSGIGFLPGSATASSFGNIKTPNKNDLALGLITLIAEANSKTLAVNALRVREKTIICTGKMLKSKIFIKILKKKLGYFKLKIIIPKGFDKATAFGAALFG